MLLRLLSNGRFEAASESKVKNAKQIVLDALGFLCFSQKLSGKIFNLFNMCVLPCFLNVGIIKSMGECHFHFLNPVFLRISDRRLESSSTSRLDGCQKRSCASDRAVARSIPISCSWRSSITSSSRRPRARSRHSDNRRLAATVLSRAFSPHHMRNAKIRRDPLRQSAETKDREGSRSSIAEGVRGCLSN